MSKLSKIAETKDVAPGSGKVVEAEGHSIALFNVGGTFYAIDNACSHRGGPLGEGALTGEVVTCPWHRAQFNVETGAVLAMGTFIGATTKIVDRDTGEILMGRVPAYSVVVPGSLPGKNLPDGRPGPSLYCAVIVKKVDEGTRARTSINELLRE